MELQTVTQTITDPADWDGSLFGTQLELVQLMGAAFRSSQTVTDLGEGVKLLRLSVNQPVKVRSRPLTLRYVATLFDRSHGGHYAGASIEAGQLLIMPPAFDFDASIKDGSFSCTSFFVPPEQLESYFQTLVGTELPKFDSLKIVLPEPSSLQWINAWPDLVATENLELLPSEERSKIQESLRDEALSTLTRSLQTCNSDQGKDLEISNSPSRLAKARNLIRLAEDFSNNCPNNTVRMVDLCRATEVSERTLQYAFKTCLGISPMNYLKRHRLHQVRRELKTANPTNSTVSRIACQFGFFHFGEFSQSYKAQFDESPSQTLKQA